METRNGKYERKSGLKVEKEEGKYENCYQSSVEKIEMSNNDLKLIACVVIKKKLLAVL